MKILITGGSGLIGSALSRFLSEAGHTIVQLSRYPRPQSDINITQGYWNPDKEEVDNEALKQVEGIINLAGAPIAQRWTPKNKEIIVSSRVLSTQFIHKLIESKRIQPNFHINASAVGIYPHQLDEYSTEESALDNDFLAQVCIKWESEARRIEELGIRTSILRIGIVLSKNGGALPAISAPIKYGLGAALGSGKQLMPWIHIDDLCRQFLFLIERNDLNGVFNGVGPNPTSNYDLSKAIAKSLKKPFFFPKVPSFILKLVLGEMTATILKSSNVIPKNFFDAGFEFQLSSLQDSLDEILQ